MGPENTILLLAHWNYKKQAERNSNKLSNGNLKSGLKSPKSKKKYTNVRFGYKYFGVTL